MKLRLLRCATMCPFGGRLPASLLPPRLTCNVLLVEAPSGLVLVDTGVGEADLADPSRLGPVSRLLGLAWLPELTARRQVEALGHKASDVRHILVTHLDLDHAGGLPDFPGATVHLLEAERAAALAPAGLRRKQRYRSCHWAHGPRWRGYDAEAGEPWNGFARVRALDGLPPELLLVSLPGHTPGHAGAAVRADGGWVLHAGDAFYEPRELSGSPSPLMRPFRRLAHDDFARAGATRAALGALARRGDVRVLCAHDPAAELPAPVS